MSAQNEFLEDENDSDAHEGYSVDELTEESRMSTDGQDIEENSESEGSAISEDGDQSEFVESQIEGDFERLLGDIRKAEDGADGSGTSMLSRIWDVPRDEDIETQFQADLRAASGIGKVTKAFSKGKAKAAAVRQRRREGPQLSHEVRSLIGQGNSAFVEGNIQEAMRIMTEVLRIEPRALSAWAVLAACYRELGDPRRALSVTVVAAHLRHDSDEWVALALQSESEGLIEQALYCYAKAARLLAPHGADARMLWDRAALAARTGRLNAARSSYLALLRRHHPHDPVVLAELRHVLIELGDLRPCIELYQDALNHYTTTHPEGKPTEPTYPSRTQPETEPSAIDPSLAASDIAGPSTAQLATEPGVPSPFGFMEILVLADLYNSFGWYEHAIKTIRTGYRWLQGRTRQKYWDACTDDREYDLPEFVREDGAGIAAGEQQREGTLMMQQGFYELDINARHRLAIARLKLGDIEEGRLHASVILSQDVADYAPLFTEIADALFERTLYTEAKSVYELLGADASTSSLHILLRAAESRRNLGELQDAAEVYEYIISIDPTNNESKMRLAEIYESTGQPRKALELVYQVIDSRKRRMGIAQDTTLQQVTEEADTAELSLFNERRKGKAKSSTARTQKGLSREELEVLERKREEEVLEWYAKVQQLQDRMRAGEEEAGNEWLIYAEKLLDMFRETRPLFPAKSSRPFTGMIRAGRNQKERKPAEAEEEEENMASRLELELEHESRAKKTQSTGRKEVFFFRGLHFGDWLALAMEYSFLLTRRDQFEVAEDVLRHLLYSLVFQRQAYQDTLRLSLATCALRAGRHAIVLEMGRKLMLTYQFNNEPVRIFLAAFASGLAQTDQVINTNFQKFLLREMRTGAAAVAGAVQWVSQNRRYSILGPSSVPSTSAAAATAADEDAEDADEASTAGDPVAAELENIPSGPPSRDVVPRPTKHNPVYPTLYGQTLSMAKSYQSAIFYLLQAYDYFPHDPVICLSLCVASLGRAMQRQADNRNYLIIQAMGFLTKYREMRGAGEDDPYADEIEYNYGRAFHQIGLFSHAVKHYQRVLKIVEKRQKADTYLDRQDAGLAREAAYNLSLVYVMTGATQLAQSLYRRWLSL